MNEHFWPGLHATPGTTQALSVASLGPAHTGLLSVPHTCLRTFALTKPPLPLFTWLPPHHCPNITSLERPSLITQQGSIRVCPLTHSPYCCPALFLAPFFVAYMFVCLP